MTGDLKGPVGAGSAGNTAPVKGAQASISSVPHHHNYRPIMSPASTTTCVAHVLLLMHQTLPLQACAELTFHHFKEEDLSVVENHFFHVTFWVNMSTCKESNTSHKIIVHTRTKTGSLEYDGTITYWNDTCTERPGKSVRCISPTGPAELNRTVNRSHVQIEWELISTHSDSSTFIRKNLTVLYPPKVSSFTIDKNEVNGNYLINEGKEVNISCSFDKGNPQTVFFLLDKTGKEINVSRSEEQLIHSVTVRCQDDWPLVRCEGTGSEKNTSVTLLAKSVVAGKTPIYFTLQNQQKFI
ncbi:uncharacterized protein LOC112569589 [Pomacea canaliculata]|uniref:uncharacterized protein LOC112569589 n=1 Tax=Pomacea canaliculata TaxID=400727 RepID=UPI000D73ECAA|nr:uncharacterized protein LOC112569589 [Pomacea canaliculata]